MCTKWSTFLHRRERVPAHKDWHKLQGHGSSPNSVLEDLWLDDLLHQKQLTDFFVHFCHSFYKLQSFCLCTFQQFAFQRDLHAISFAQKHEEEECSRSQVVCRVRPVPDCILPDPPEFKIILTALWARTNILRCIHINARFNWQSDRPRIAI